ncbi:hypothetical protein LCGC14_2760280, partial [marine sediment metagenome]
GNGNENFDLPIFRNTGLQKDSGAIVVGAGIPPTNYDYDGSDREVEAFTDLDGVTTEAVYTNYESGEVAARKRVTAVTYNSDGSKRYLTHIYGYHTSGNGVGKLRFIVGPEGVKRYLAHHPEDTGVDPADPGADCELDDLDEAPDATLQDYASVVYVTYDAQGRVSKKSGPGAGCGVCGQGSGAAVGIWYVTNGSHSSGEPNSWKTARRTCLLDSVGDPLDEAGTVVFLNEWGQTVYSIRQTVTRDDTEVEVDEAWITHYKYVKNEANYGDAIPRLTEVRQPSACVGYTVNTTSVTIVNDDYEWVTEPTVDNNDTTGLVRLYEYGTSDSGTDYVYATVTYNGKAKKGDFKGKLKYEKVRKGTTDNNSIEYLVRKHTYVRTERDGVKVHHPYKETVYPNYTISDSGGDTTKTDYVFFKDGDN